MGGANCRPQPKFRGYRRRQEFYAVFSVAEPQSFHVYMHHACSLRITVSCYAIRRIINQLFDTTDPAVGIGRHTTNTRPDYTRGHKYNLYKSRCECVYCTSNIFCRAFYQCVELVVIGRRLDCSSLTSFKSTIYDVVFLSFCPSVCQTRAP